MRELDGMRIIGPADGDISEGARSKRRELISASETGGRWSLGEVTAEPDESVATHVHPGEPEAFLIVDGEVELHGAEGVAHLGPGDVVFISLVVHRGSADSGGNCWPAARPSSASSNPGVVAAHR